MDSKECNKCQEVLPLVNFHKSGGGKRRASCKLCCSRERRRLQDLKNPRGGKTGRSCVFTREEQIEKNKNKCRKYYITNRLKMKKRIQFLYKCKRLEKKLLRNVKPYMV